MDEQKIIKQCLRGDQNAFGELYEAYIKKIYNFVYYKTHHKETAQDLTSLTFLKALEKLALYKQEAGSFSSWLYQIARNNVIDFYRTKKSDANIDDAFDLHDDHDFLQDIDTQTKLSAVKNHLQKLNSTQREIIILRVWEELDYEEISKIVGKTADNCKMIFSRGLKALKQSIGLPLLLYFFTLNLKNLWP